MLHRNSVHSFSFLFSHLNRRKTNQQIGLIIPRNRLTKYSWDTSLLIRILLRAVKRSYPLKHVKSKKNLVLVEIFTQSSMKKSLYRRTCHSTWVSLSQRIISLATRESIPDIHPAFNRWLQYRTMGGKNCTLISEFISARRSESCWDR
jgi:hypothetical protein